MKYETSDDNSIIQFCKTLIETTKLQTNVIIVQSCTIGIIIIIAILAIAKIIIEL